MLLLRRQRLSEVDVCRRRRPLVFVLDGAIYLAAVDLDLARRFNSDADVVPLHFHDMNDDVVADHDLLARLARQY